MSWPAKNQDAARQQIKPPAQVYQEHVQILREINAPEKLIKIAEQVSASAVQKK